MAAQDMLMQYVSNFPYTFYFFERKSLQPKSHQKSDSQFNHAAFAHSGA